MKLRIQIAVLCSSLLLSSCASLTPERIEMIANIAGLAAQIGAAVWLQKHPDQRPIFEAALAAIQALIRAGNTNPDSYTEVLSRLKTVDPITKKVTGTDMLAGPLGDVMVSPVPGAGVLVWDGNKAVRIQGNAVLPVAKRIARGLRDAMAPVPPKLPKVLSGGQ